MDILFVLYVVPNHKEIANAGKIIDYNQSIARKPEAKIPIEQKNRLTVQSGQFGLYFESSDKHLIMDSNADEDKIDVMVNGFLEKGNKDEIVIVSVGKEVKWRTVERLMALTKKHGYKSSWRTESK